MATSNEQLKNIYEDLKAKFDNHPFIKVIPSEGDPPEKYEIQYSILGLIQDSDGKVIESNTHSVFINIPFGYPHFPPSCTPQSPTFHPDFDQAAICIGEFWNKDRSLADLVVHIGQMISGEIFSTENAFNDAATDWYQKIAENLPFEKMDFSFSSSPEEPEITFDEEDLLLEGMDTLDDSDITGHPDYFASDQPTLEEDEISFPSTAKSSGKSSVNRVYLLIRQKRFYELSGFLNELGEEDNFDDRIEIEQKISDLLEKAKTLQREADEFEHQGNPKMALELFEKVASIVPDFPNIDENIERTRNSVELAGGDWETESDSGDSGASDHDKTESKKRRVAFFEDGTKKSIRLLPILAIVLVIVLAIVFITPFFTAKSHLETAGELYQQCQKFIDQGNFNQADIQCSEAVESLKKISLYKTGDRDKLERQIALTLNSEKMQQGLVGRVFFQGKFINKTDRDRLLEFNRQKTEGDLFYEKSQWKNAIGQYNAAIKTAQPISDGFIDVLLQETRNKITVSDINLSIDRGFSLLARGELEKSKEMFASALGDAEKLPEELGGDLISRIQPKIQEIQYLQHLDLGKKFFSANDWESAIKQYEKALQLRDASITPLADDASLYANMAEAELFALINSAKDAFSQSLLDDAIKNYQAAISLLESKNDLLKRINPDEIQQQLERIILRTRIVQFKQLADKELSSQKFDEAIAIFNKTIAVINQNGFEEDQEFKAIIDGTKEEIAETNKKAIVAGRIEYLEKNYKTIFEENYSAAVPEYLSEPKVTFLRYFDNGKELYEIQCLEENRGRKLRLVMLYSYDPTRKRWAFYSENS
jgi:tetratricopeptide (TPR) repeat protein